MTKFYLLLMMIALLMSATVLIFFHQGQEQQQPDSVDVIDKPSKQNPITPPVDNKPNTTSVSKTIHGKPFTINIYEDNDIVSQFVKSSAGWEPEIIQELTTTFQKYADKHNIPLSNLTFVDIGANIGWLTMNMAAFGVNVVAFEPMQENIDLINKSLQDPKNVKNGVSARVRFFPHGLGTKDEVCIIYSENINVGDGVVNCVDDEKKQLKIPRDYVVRGRILVHRLDDVVNAKKEGLNIVMIKMDTEGYECNVMEGGSNLLLRSGARVILTEFTKTWMIERGGDPTKFMKDIGDAGYRLKRTERLTSSSSELDRDFMTKEEMLEAVVSGDLKDNRHDLALYSEEHLSELYGTDASTTSKTK